MLQLAYWYTLNTCTPVGLFVKC